MKYHKFRFGFRKNVKVLLCRIFGHRINENPANHWCERCGLAYEECYYPKDYFVEAGILPKQPVEYISPNSGTGTPPYEQAITTGSPVIIEQGTTSSVLKFGNAVEIRSCFEPETDTFQSSESFLTAIGENEQPINTSEIMTETNPIENPPHKKVAVILHLFYIDLWEYFVPYLKNINTDIDLYITIPESYNNDFDAIVAMVSNDFPSSYVFTLPNRGMDIAPFLYVMNQIIESGDTYDVIIKLHSKKSLMHEEGLGERWRNQLTDALIGSVMQLTHNYQSCFESGAKMVASSSWVLNQKVTGYEQDFFAEIINFDEYEFVGGTMFMVNFDLLKEWFIKDQIFERFYDKFEEGYIGDGSLAHQFERVFGCLIKLNGAQILKV